MAVSYREGNILDVTGGIICQQVNCRRVMGAGLAKQIATKYPVVRDAFMEQEPALGLCTIVPVTASLKVANIYGQLDYGREPGVKYTKYTALKVGLQSLESYASSRCPRPLVHIPYGIGCGLAHGDWTVVSEIITDVFGPSDVQAYVYRLPGTEIQLRPTTQHI